MKNPTDKRVLKTQELINNAFLELLQEIGYKKITVKAVCERAHISRKTFYLHYETIEVLLNSLIIQLFPIASTSFMTDALNKYKELGDTPEFDKYYRKLEITCLKQMHKNSKELKIFLSQKNHDAFVDVLKRNIFENAPKINTKLEKDQFHNSHTEFSYKLYIDILVTGLTWAYQQKNVTAEEVIDKVHEDSKAQLMSLAKLIEL